MSYEQPAFHIEGNPDATTDGSKMTIKTDAMEKGITYINVTAADNDGNKTTRRIGICIL